MQNRTTVALKEAILRAAEETGSDKRGKGGLTGYLTFLAKDEPKSFAVLLGKVLPLQIAGDPENPLKHAITVRFVSPKERP